MKGAIFDADGTLLDSMPVWEDLGVRYLRGLGIKAEEGLNKVLFSMSLDEAADYLKERYQLAEDRDQIIQDVLRIVNDYYCEEAPLKAGVKPFLEAMERKGISMAVATSSGREQIEQAFQRLEILKYFQEIFTCSEVGAGKSEPLIYKMAADYMGTRPEETYVFEDVLHAVKTAGKAGFYTIGIYDAASAKDWADMKALADESFDNWEQAMKIIEPL